MSKVTQRIVSLLPAATEIVAHLGLVDRLVGVSSDCDWPPRVSDLPVVSATEIDESAPSESIDRQVRQRAHSGKSLYHVNSERLEDLAPDLVITQEQCEVCAPSFEAVSKSCRRLDGDPDILSLEAETLEEVLETIETVGQAVDSVGTARSLVEDLRLRQEKLSQDFPASARSPGVACIEWYNPPFKAGHWIPEMVETIGGEPLSDPGEHSEEISFELFEDFDPEHLILMPCGFQTDRAAREGREFLERLYEKTGLNSGAHTVSAVNGSYFFNRPGPRLWDGIAILRAVVFPATASELELPDDAIRRLA